jgi:hypothetical protein
MRFVLLHYVVVAALAMTLGPSAKGQDSSKVIDRLSSALGTEVGASEPRLIRWPAAPTVYLVSTSAVPDADRRIAEETIRRVKEKCACIARIETTTTLERPEHIENGNIVIVMDRDGFAALHQEATDLVSWAYPSADAMLSALPPAAATRYSNADFRYRLDGNEVDRAIVAISTHGKPGAIKALLLSGLIASLSPMLSQVESGAQHYLEKSTTEYGADWNLSADGYAYLALLYDPRLKAGMTSSEIEQALK